MAVAKPDLATRASDGELVVLVWKGGFEKKLDGQKYGTLQYLATWQGLRGDGLDIDMVSETSVTCTKTGMTVVYTAEVAKYAKPQNSDSDDEGLFA